MPRCTADVSEYIKIRRYVMTLILRAGNKKVLLPSIQELSERFAVSRPTVCKAMSTLTDQGYVIGKRGLGSYTNPEKRPIVFDNTGHFQHQTIIGIITGDGMLVHYDCYLALILSELLKAAASLPSLVHLVPISSTDTVQICRTIENEQLDGLVCHQPSQKIFQTVRKMYEQGFPVAVGEYPEDFPASVRLDYENAGYLCGKKLLAEKRYNVAYCLNLPPWDAPLNGLRRAFHAAGRTFSENLVFNNIETYLDDLRKLVRFGAPLDAVYCTFSNTYSIGDLMAKENPDISKRCLIIESALSAPPAIPFRRILYDAPYQKYGTELISCLKLQMKKQNVSPVKIPLIIKTTT